MIGQKVVTTKRARICTPLKILFFMLNVCLLLRYFFSTVRAMGSASSQYNSAYSNKHIFMSAIGQFTNFRVAKRIITKQDLHNTTDLEPSEGQLLRFFISDYLSFHKDNRASNTRRLIYTPSEVGNGDRFDCMLFAYWVAVLSRRVLLLDWNEPFPLSLFLKSASGAKLFMPPKGGTGLLSTPTHCEPPICLLLNETNLDYYERALFSDAKTVHMHSHKIPFRISKSLLREHGPKKLSPLMVHKFRSSQIFRRAVLHHVLKLSDSMKEDHNRISDEMGLTSGAILSQSSEKRVWTEGLNPVGKKKRRRYIGVHARLGKGVGEFPTGRFRVVATRMKDVARCLASRAVRLAVLSGSPPLPIFLATDTAEFREIFKELVEDDYEEEIDVIFGDWSMIHVAKVPLEDQNTRGSGHGKTWNAFWGGFMDLTLLGHAEHIVSLYSGFPRLAMSLGDAQTLIEIRNEICLEVN